MEPTTTTIAIPAEIVKMSKIMMFSQGLSNYTYIIIYDFNNILEAGRIFTLTAQYNRLMVAFIVV